MDFVAIIIASSVFLVIIVGYFLYITRSNGGVIKTKERVDLSVAPLNGPKSKR